MKDRMIFAITIMVIGILMITFLDGGWDAFGVFLMLWSNNMDAEYKKDELRTKNER